MLYALIITVAAGVSAAAILNAEPLQSANDRSRWATVWSLVERGTFRIDQIDRAPRWSTIDKVRHEGHFYSSKPPLLSTLVAGLYWGVKQLTGWDIYTRTWAVTRALLLMVNLVPMIVAWGLIAVIAERYARHDFSRFYLLLAATFGTLLTPFLVTLNNHTLGAVSVVFAVYPAFRIFSDGERRPLLFAMCGFWAAFACCNELPAALLGLLLFGLLCWQAPRQTLLYFVPGALIPLAAFFYTNWLVTGGVKPFYTYYGTEKYRYVVDGVPSYWMEPRGVDRNLDSALMYLFHCTFGHHGIFSLSPIVLLTVATWAHLRRWQPGPFRTFLWMALVLSVVVLAFYLTRTENYNYGGVSAGLRWTLWLVPLWLVAMIPALDRWSRSRGFRWTAVALLAVSTFSAWYPIANPWQQPWLFKLMHHWGWIDYSDPPPKFERTLWTWFSSLPEPPAWIELSGREHDGSTIRLRLSATEAESVRGRTARRVIAELRSNGEPTETQRLLILAEPFEEGRPPEEFLVAEGGDVEQWRKEVGFIRGLPRPRPYNAGVIRYLHTPLRKDAFRSQRAASQVLDRDSDLGQTHLYRVDTWLSDEVPFGVLQLEFTVSDPATGDILSRRRLTATSISHLPAPETQ